MNLFIIWTKLQEILVNSIFYKKVACCSKHGMCSQAGVLAKMKYCICLTEDKVAFPEFKARQIDYSRWCDLHIQTKASCNPWLCLNTGLKKQGMVPLYSRIYKLGPFSTTLSMFIFQFLSHPNPWRLLDTLCCTALPHHAKWIQYFLKVFLVLIPNNTIRIKLHVTGNSLQLHSLLEATRFKRGSSKASLSKPLANQFFKIVNYLW